MTGIPKEHTWVQRETTVEMWSMSLFYAAVKRGETLAKWAADPIAVHFLPTLTPLHSRIRFEAFEAANDCSLYNRFDDQCQIRPFSVALIFEGTSYTWRDLELGKSLFKPLSARIVEKRIRVSGYPHNTSPLTVTTVCVFNHNSLEPDRKFNRPTRQPSLAHSTYPFTKSLPPSFRPIGLSLMVSARTTALL